MDFDFFPDDHDGLYLSFGGCLGEPFLRVPLRNNAGVIICDLYQVSELIGNIYKD
jgi:hypothetical protein